MKCEVVSVLVDLSGAKRIGPECGKPAQFCDGNTWFCFTCARSLRDILTPRGERRFREIERVVCALPS